METVLEHGRTRKKDGKARKAALAVMFFVGAVIAAPANLETFLKTELARRGARYSSIQVDPVPAVGIDGLEITQIQYDPVHAKTYFRIRDNQKHSFEVGVSGSILFPILVADHELEASAEVSASDFRVDYRPLSSLVSPSAEELAGRKTRRRIAAGEVVRPEMFSVRSSHTLTRSLVQAGRTAVLLYEGPGFTVSRKVIPVDSGDMGQSIRVHAPDSDKVFRATVVDRDKLKGEQQ